MLQSSETTPSTQDTEPTRIQIKTCRSKGLKNACLWARPVLEDAGNYIIFIARHLQDSGTVEICREARTVLLDNIRMAVDKIDLALAEFSDDCGT